MLRWRAVSLNDKSYKFFLSHIVLIQFVMVVNASESCRIPENAVTRRSQGSSSCVTPLKVALDLFFLFYPQEKYFNFHQTEYHGATDGYRDASNIGVHEV